MDSDIYMRCLLTPKSRPAIPGNPGSRISPLSLTSGKYIGEAANTVPMDRTSSAVRRALQLITDRIHQALGHKAEFNEVLTAAYLQRQKMAVNPALHFLVRKFIDSLLVSQR